MAYIVFIMFHQKLSLGIFNVFSRAEKVVNIRIATKGQ